LEADAHFTHFAILPYATIRDNIASFVLCIKQHPCNHPINERYFFKNQDEHLRQQEALALSFDWSGRGSFHTSTFINTQTQ
jgi:hypothetical protein